MLVEDLCCSSHSVLVAQASRDSLSFLRVEVAGLHKQLLELKHIIVNVFVILQKFVLVLGLSQLEELLPQTVKGSLQVDLQVLDLIHRLDQVGHAELKLLYFW